MAKYYQHILPGSEDLGKVTTLKCIDDVSDDDIILYRFNDGTACNKAFIADAGNDNAFNGKYAMVELFNPNAKWTFETHEVTLGETKTYTDPNTGQTYDIPAPGIQQNGQYGGSFGTGDSGIKASAKDGQMRTDATPPVFYGKRKVEPEDAYILSDHPELSDEPVISDIPVNEKIVNTVAKEEHKQVLYEEIKTDPVQKTTESLSVPTVENGPIPPILNADTSVSFISTAQKDDYFVKYDEAHIIKIKDPDLYIDLNKFKETIHITFDGKDYKFNNEEFKKLLDKSEKTEPSDDVKFIKEYLDTEDILITNMIEKSKKVNGDIGMDLTLTIPPKEVYNTIKNVYPEEMAVNFIKSLAYRISIKCLVDAIAEGLAVYYDGERKNSIENEA